ncbi:MAG: glycine cleavage system aminomethyltransferase GcvT [Kaiparowitsia implicata GSE-PSE-MK54-09C]|jgi:aminomethyltransferase|nr:glycine cleavage system aminomethyltransferase GcvT [Kaiparowitsia implicata GSE-PSE-MK54-09C]
MSDLLHRTPLYDWAIAHNGRMVPFAGWHMAVQYSSLLQEHQAVRQGVGIFDISHMGKFTLRGTGVLAALQRLVPSDLSRLTPGNAQYTVLLNEQGGLIDDLIVYDQGRIDGAEQVRLIVNAATTDKDKTWLLSHLPNDVELQDQSPTHVLIAVQGPQAVATLQRLVDADLTAVPRFGHVDAAVLGQPGFFARTGYTGEDGFEVMVDAETGVELWRSLHQAGATPCGLGCRDTLRLEAAMALYGQDIDDTTSPLEAGLNWLVHLDKPGDFIGRNVLQRQKTDGVPRRLVGLQLQGRNIARHHYPVLHNGTPVGIVTSGTLSPTLGYPIALAYVPPNLGKLGQSLEVKIRSKAFPATVVKRPFYRSGI